MPFAEYNKIWFVTKENSCSNLWTEIVFSSHCVFDENGSMIRYIFAASQTQSADYLLITTYIIERIKRNKKNTVKWLKQWVLYPLGSVHKLRGQNFALFWPFIYVWWTIVDISFTMYVLSTWTIENLKPSNPIIFRAYLGLES